MTLIVTTVTPELTLFPWTRGTGEGDSVLPVAELQANKRDAAITLSGSGDTQECRTSVNLPANNVYLLKDISCSMQVDGFTNTWENIASLIYQNTISGGAYTQTIEYAVDMISEGSSIYQGGTKNVKAYRPIAPLPTFFQEGGGFWILNLNNNTLEEPVAEFNVTWRFLVYTVAQLFNARVNTPILTR